MKNINGDVILDCFLCQHSQIGTRPEPHGTVLVCSLKMNVATEWCDYFEFEEKGDKNAEA